MKKGILILAIGMCMVNSAIAQQFVMSSQYMVNSFAINPAAAGTKTYAPLVIDIRRQWVGIKEAPVAQHISYHTNVLSTVGVGGYLFNDVSGPNRRTGFMAAVSSQVKVSGDTYFSVGLAGSFTQFVFDRDKLVTEEPNDITVSKYTSNQMIPDISGGVKLYADNFHLGAAIFNGLQTKIDLFDIGTEVTSRLQRTLYVTGSYLIPLSQSQRFFLEPSAVGRVMLNAPFQFDVNLRLMHTGGVWGAVSYRFKDAIALIIGYGTETFGISYSYDINNSPLKSYNSGSHEITLTLKTRNKAAGQHLRGSKFRVINCPSF